MAAPAPHFARTSPNTAQNRSRYGPYADEDYEDEYDDAPMALEPGERIGRPRASARRMFIMKTGIVGVFALGGGWAWLNYHETLSEWTAVVAAAVAPVLERKAPGAVPPNPPLQPLQPLAVSEPSAASAVLTMQPMTTATLSPATAEPGEQAVDPSSEKLPPPVADPADPYQTRALAAGLHPGLSRVLLAKLSPTDYRNAGIAIKTALVETPDTDVFVWPPQRTAELALFQVKFVPGAVPDCRRYVVMVTKDGWLTTALPMEKCGVRQKDARK